MRLRSLHRAYPSLHSSEVVHWVPEQLNIKAVTEACKLIDGRRLALCLAISFKRYQLIYVTEMKSIQLHDSIEGLSQKIVSITLHYTLHKQCFFSRNAPERAGTRRNAPQRERAATRRNAPQRAATRRNAPQRAATRRNAPQRAATRRNAPQRAATRRNAPERRSGEFFLDIQHCL